MVEIVTPRKNHCSEAAHKYTYFEMKTIPIKKLHLNAPYPAMLEFEEILNKISDPKKDGFLNGFTILDKEGIRCDDESIAKRQSGIIAEVAKQMSKGLSLGVVSLSLPAKMFEPRSLLERHVDWWVYAPILLKQAGREKDNLTAFKHVVSFALSALYLSTEQLKPFTPYLGETFQATLDDGSQLYLEHTTHSPCISHFLLKDIEGLYTLSGYAELATEGTFKMLINNSIIIQNRGKMSVYLKESNRTIDIQFPKLNISGLLFGSRMVTWNNFLKVEDKQSHLKAVIYFNKSHDNLKKRRVHDFWGSIFFYDFQKEKEKKKKQFYDEKTPKVPDPKQQLAEIEGSYLEYLVINKEIIWDFRQNSPSQVTPLKEKEGNFVLPSDSRYREDLIWLKRGFINKDYDCLYTGYAQEWKLALEAQQRLERENRAEYQKKLKKKK